MQDMMTVPVELPEVSLKMDGRWAIWASACSRRLATRAVNGWRGHAWFGSKKAVILRHG